MTIETFLKIKQILDANKIEYTHLVHDHVHRSEEAAKIRGTSLDEAAKAIILKVQKKNDKNKMCEFIQIIIGGDQRIDLKKVRILLQSNNVALASPDEVLERTGCTIGSVPPFGRLFDLRIYMDKTLLAKDRIVFSAGTHNDSIIMNPADYFEITDPIVADLRKE